MPLSVHITTPWPSRESMIKRLHIPKARQKELRAIIDQAWERNVCQEEVPGNNMIEPGKKRKSASAA